MYIFILLRHDVVCTCRSELTDTWMNGREMSEMQRMVTWTSMCSRKGKVFHLKASFPSECKMCEIGKRPQKMPARAAGTGGRPHGSRP